jgi:hypothetical protein
MQRMPYQIVDQDSAAAYAPSLTDEVNQFGRLQVMGEQAAHNQIETGVLEGKCKSVRHDGPIFAAQMRARTIQVGQADRDPVAR